MQNSIDGITGSESFGSQFLQPVIVHLGSGLQGVSAGSIISYEEPAKYVVDQLAQPDDSESKVLAWLTPIQGQQVEFWPNRMPRKWAGIKGVFEGGRFWSLDKADFWMPSEVASWQSVGHDGHIGRGCVVMGKS